MSSPASTASSPPSPVPLPEADDPVRIELITAIEAQLGDLKLDQSSWAALWLADISELERHADSFDREKFDLMSAFRPAASVVQNWAAKTQPEKDDEPTAKKSRSKTVPEMVLKRDADQCLLTQAGEPLEVAHLYPFCLYNREGTQQQIRFWGHLRLFWSEERVAAWKAAVLGPSGTEIIPNMMALRSDVHELWGRARFALKPGQLSSDGKRLPVKFYWLPAEEWTAYRPLFPSPDDGQFSSTSVYGAKLINCETLKVLRSGAELTFETADPVNYPLPSTDILDMQWAIARLQALSGAAEVDETVIWPDRHLRGAGLLSTQHDDDNDDDAPPRPSSRLPFRAPPRQPPAVQQENVPFPRLQAEERDKSSSPAREAQPRRLF